MANSSVLDRVADVDIDANGTFKYILINVETKDGSSKEIVRGYEWAQYHGDILDRVSAKFCELGLEYDCLGGGRIEHNKADKNILVYGYSMGFGRADHTIAVEKLKKHYPDYNQITFKNEGY
ncbi:14 kDa phosphohistidine phosphatase-like [Dysidea avara]|uniref:14 kDa phosphohistidine phosphatase-like n=1 Tax=Dysidea avara TaxID=196820 RepID=UPI003318BE1B